MKKRELSVGIVAPSSVVPQLELRASVERLRAAGFKVEVHPQCSRRHRFFAGTDDERARGFHEFAMRPDIDVLWCARGGYGAARILGQLEDWTRKKARPPRKLLAGYSDATALHAFVSERWRWSTLHCPMPGMREFLTLSRAQERSILSCIRGDEVALPWTSKSFRFLGRRPKRPVRGIVAGGNLALLASMAGTRFMPDLEDKILLLEDIGEAFYRLDRMVTQLEHCGALDGVRALLLGTFDGCTDSVAQALRRMPSSMRRPNPTDFKPLRPRLSSRAGISAVFGELGERLGIPVLAGLPVGHGSGMNPLPLGASVEVSVSGKLEFLDWDWAR